MNHYLLITLFLLSCAPGNKKSELNWMKPDLKGHWKVIDAEIVEEVPFLNLGIPEPIENMTTEDSPWDGYVGRDLIFENDSMYWIDYPIQASKTLAYHLDTGYVHIVSDDNLHTYPTEVINDTFYFYSPIPDYGYFKETYVRTNFNDSILNVMKMYGINYPELSGTWLLVREDSDGHGAHYELKFPHKISDSITFNREQMINALENEKIYIMLTDGIKRDYSFYYSGGNIYFEPGEWCTDEDKWIYYSRE